MSFSSSNTAPVKISARMDSLLLRGGSHFRVRALLEYSHVEEAYLRRAVRHMEGIGIGKFDHTFVVTPQRILPSRQMAFLKHPVAMSARSLVEYLVSLGVEGRLPLVEVPRRLL